MPTSPVNTPSTESEIEAVFGDDGAVQSRAAPAASMRAEWSRLGAFLKRPSLAVSEQNGAALTVIGRIFVLDLLAMLVLIALATIAIGLGVYLPETALAGIEFTPLVILAVIVGAPVFEELIFRGWLSGKPGPVLGLLCVAGGTAGFGVAHMSNPVIGIALFFAGLIAGALALYGLRNRPAMRWFAAIFPALFWLSTLGFALVHIANFDTSGDWGSLAILLPLVMPQFILGMLLGYLRVRIGLWAAMLLHALHNATAIGIAALAMALS